MENGIILPFSGEIVQAPHDQFIWGRGAIDIKNLGTANLTALFTLLKEGFRPKGNLKILLCADEKQGGHIGLDRLIQDHFDAVRVRLFHFWIKGINRLL